MYDSTKSLIGYGSICWKLTTNDANIGSGHFDNPNYSADMRKEL